MKHLPITAVAIALTLSAALAQSQNDVLKADESYRLAKLNADTAALDRILAPAFNETNQNGNSRNKAQTIDLWKTFRIDTLTTDSAEVRISGDTAQVLGRQTENGAEHMLFTRVYIRGGAGWQLLASMQYRDPDSQMPVAIAAVPQNTVQDPVMKAEEAFRLAKLQHDVPALQRILAAEFNETNQNGHSRNKAETLDLWRSFPISSLTTDAAEVRIAGDTAMVLGKQTENGTEHMLFTRVYINRDNGWQLLSSMQFRDPNDSRNTTM